MKTLLTILLLTSVYAKGQTTDTIPVIMLISDTSLHSQNDYDEVVYNPALKGTGLTGVKQHYRYWRNNETWTTRGYEVGYSDHTVDRNAMDLISTTQLIWHHLEYLDEKKRPFTNYVWISKQIK